MTNIHYSFLSLGYVSAKEEKSYHGKRKEGPTGEEATENHLSTKGHQVGSNMISMG
jgi:hypothetical protein